MKKLVIIVSLTLGLGIFGWIFWNVTEPKPEQKLADIGDNHVPLGTKIKYNSNPPTSGNHYADWKKSGVYNTPDDGFLVHSLEHGYVIISYNCRKPKANLPFLFFATLAQADEGQEGTGSASLTESTTSAELPGEFQSSDCQKLVSQLTEIYRQKGQLRIIVIPRPNMGTQIALTAWTYLDKFNLKTADKLSDGEKTRIEQFIDAHLNQGPEKTVEKMPNS